MLIVVAIFYIVSRWLCLKKFFELGRLAQALTLLTYALAVPDTDYPSGFRGFLQILHED
jgi:hypothetical protein